MERVVLACVLIALLVVVISNMHIEMVADDDFLRHSICTDANDRLMGKTSVQ